MTIKLVDQESLCYKKICTRSQFEQNIQAKPVNKIK